VPSRSAFADDVSGEIDLPAEPQAQPDPIEPLPEPEPIEKDAPPPPLDDGGSGSPPEAPGLKWWAIDTAVTSTVSWGATLAFNKNIRDGVTSSSFDEWGDNISQTPEWNDDSNTVTNYVAHPLLGATWFMAYRSRGHGIIASSLGVVFQSFFLEYIIEGPHNVPSAHDMVFTPLVGIPIGYGLDTLSLYLLKQEKSSLRYLGYVANPFHLLPSAKKHRWAFSFDPASRSFAISGRF
jgi:hypothetical protein